MFPTFYESRKFITAFTRDTSLSLSLATLSQSIPPSNYLNMCFDITLPSSLCLNFSLSFAIKTAYACLLSLCVPHAPPISHSLIWSPEQYLVKSTRHDFPHYATFTLYSITSCFFDPNVFLKTRLLKTSSLCLCLICRNQVSQPYKTTTKFQALSILIII
jgi:hypothetical protein